MGFKKFYYNKILLVFGTRPEAIKCIPIIKEFSKHKDKIDFRICVTGQHRELLDQVLSIFHINPNYDLNVMETNQTLSSTFSIIIKKVDLILKEFQPNIVLVHGDTTTAAATALASYYNQIDIGHIEAGLRSNNLYSPWPEEGNRKIIAQIATYHFATTHYTYKNLIKENVNKKNIFIVGNTIIDLLKNIDLKNKKLPQELDNFLLDKFIFITFHRREKSPQTIEKLYECVYLIAEKYNIKILLLIHKNPYFIIKKTTLYNKIAKNKNIKIISSIDYITTLQILKKTYLVLTDSGGLQEETSFFGKPLLLLRKHSDRQEIINKNVKIVGYNIKLILKYIDVLLKNKYLYQQLSVKEQVFGNGTTSEKIVNFLLNKQI